jgi:RecA/RadA recombinase
MDKETEDVKKALTIKKDFSTSIPSSSLLSSGSTLLNLACSGKTTGAFAKGHYVFFVGDSSSGKTFLSMTCMAEASINPEFDDYDLIADLPENGAQMDIEKFFGRKLADRLRPPKGTIDDPVYSTTTKEFYDTLDDLFAAGKPFIYLLDSNDALSSAEEEAKHTENQNARKKGTKEKEGGTYGTSRAKDHSTRLRRICNQLKRIGAILIIIGQTRQNIGFMAQFDPTTRAGGKALTFYAQLELWTSIRSRMKKKVPGKKKEVETGVLSQVKIKKNRLTGRRRTVEIPIYYTAGIDDVGSCVRYLIDEGHWSETGKGVIDAPEFQFSGKFEPLVKKIEFLEAEPKLRKIVRAVWSGVEEASAVRRKNKYR